MQRLRDLGGNGKKTHIVVSDPKSFASERDIPLGGFAAELCRRFYADKPLAYVLTGSESRYVEPRALQYKMRRYCETCELSGVHFHSLRHSFATRCVEVGFDIKSLSEVLGHSSPQITLERYVHSSIELKRENMGKLAAIGY
jgi:site-specific recombinase xerC